MDTENSAPPNWAIFLITAFSLALGLTLGYCYARDTIRVELVKRGLGRWEIVSPGGATEFKYNEPPK